MLVLVMSDEVLVIPVRPILYNSRNRTATNSLYLYGNGQPDRASIPYTKHKSDDPYAKWTIVSPNLENIENDDELTILNRSRAWTNRKVMCMVIQCPDYSSLEYQDLTCTIFEAIFCGINNPTTLAAHHIHGLLAVQEFSKTKGNHLHILYFTPIQFATKTMRAIETKYSSTSYKLYCDDDKNLNEKRVSLIATCQNIKSPASYLHYLKKDLVTVFCNNIELLTTFVQYQRTHIFDKHSTPKRQRLDLRVNSTSEPLIKLIFNMIQEGVTNFNELIADVRMHPYLSKPNLENIFKNCKVSVQTDMTFIKALTSIVRRYNDLPANEKCACPYIEWFIYQDLDIYEIVSIFFDWLTGKGKKNAIWFQSPPSYGKSHMARYLWSSWHSCMRVVQDSHFLFANVPSSDCCLWDEPYIPPDLVETIKLVLEGEPTADVAVKGLGTKKLGKRIPFILTSNHDLWKYCSAAKDALLERVHHITVSKKFDARDICNNEQHYCPNIDPASSAFNPFKSSTSTSTGESERRSEDIPFVPCSQHHIVYQSHAYSFIVLVLNRLKENICINPLLGSKEDYINLHAELVRSEHTICVSSELLHANLDKDAYI